MEKEKVINMLRSEAIRATQAASEEAKRISADVKSATEERRNRLRNRRSLTAEQAILEAFEIRKSLQPIEARWKELDRTANKAWAAVYAATYGME